MEYVRAFHTDTEHSEQYLLKSLHQKTQQQVRLEEILAPRALKPERIADIACGSGSLSYHLSRLYPDAQFTLLDLSDQSLNLARKVGAEFNAQILQGDCCDIPLPGNEFDLVFFWHTLLGMEEPERAVRELLRICKPGGSVLISSLFNTEADVDLYVSAIDHTRGSGAQGIRLPYYCFSARTVATWTDAQAIFHDFDIGIDLPKTSRGVGTYTVRLASGSRLQISGGILMNWKILELRKAHRIPTQAPADFT